MTSSLPIGTDLCRCSGACVDLRGALRELAPSQRIPCTLAVLPTHAVESWPAMLATAFRGADFLRDVRQQLVPVLRTLHGRGLRVFDSDRARRGFEALPTRVAVYRGTVHDEFDSGEYGCSWTVDPAIAHNFALRSFIGDGCDPDAVVLTATISRDDIAGLLTRLGEHEVLICPDRLHAVACVPFQPQPER